MGRSTDAATLATLMVHAMGKMYDRVSWLILLPLMLFSTLALASIDEVLARKTAPEGVVFEIVQGSEQDIAWAVEQIIEDVGRLREKFPGLAVAVVSHGREEFGLTRSAAKTMPKVHSLVRDLTTNQDVPVHVCGTHASWYGVTPEDFPDYVDVSTTGPAQINDYVSLGYVKVLVRRRK